MGPASQLWNSMLSEKAGFQLFLMGTSIHSQSPIDTFGWTSHNLEQAAPNLLKKQTICQWSAHTPQYSDLGKN
jgi:hypothetical protein